MVCVCVLPFFGCLSQQKNRAIFIFPGVLIFKLKIRLVFGGTKNSAFSIWKFFFRQVVIGELGAYG